MSYAGPVRPRGASRATSVKRSSTLQPHDTDWQQVAVFGAGLALGLALGAGIALITAPQSGQDARAALRRKATHTSRALGRRSRDAWTDVRDELAGLSRAISQRKARRAAARELERESALD